MTEQSTSESLSDPEEDFSLSPDVDLGAAKKVKIEAAKSKLLRALDSGNFKDLTTRVAYILNVYPKSRDSDITLAINYWKTYQPELYKDSGILPKDLFLLERQTNLTRARAKIQNEYLLFVASSDVKVHRNAKQEMMETAVLETQQQLPLIKIFSDESGKTGDQNTSVLVGSVWIYNANAMARLAISIGKFREEYKKVGKEFHFNELKRNDVGWFKAYVDIVSTNLEYISIKCAGVKKSRVASRKIEDVVRKLNEYVINRGIEHEVQSGRIDLPRTLSIAIDYESSIDVIALTDMQNNVETFAKNRFGDNLKIANFVTVDSSNSEFIQLADLIVSSVSRKLNTQGDNHKDECADYLINMLNVDLGGSDVKEDFDSAVTFHV